MGPTVCKGLKGKFGAGKVACQGVGGPYKAGLETNVLPEGTNAAAYQEAMKLLAKASTKCPQSKIVAGGYR
jgi:cutinase